MVPCTFVSSYLRTLPLKFRTFGPLVGKFVPFVPLAYPEPESSYLRTLGGGLFFVWNSVRNEGLSSFWSQGTKVRDFKAQETKGTKGTRLQRPGGEMYEGTNFCCPGRTLSQASGTDCKGTAVP